MTINDSVEPPGLGINAVAFERGAPLAGINISWHAIDASHWAALWHAPGRSRSESALIDLVRPGPGSNAIRRVSASF